VSTDSDQSAIAEEAFSTKITEPNQLPSLAKSKAYYALLSLARRDKQNYKSLRLLLILINAHPQLKAHYRIFENLAIILNTPPVEKALAANPSWGAQIPNWKDLCQWVIANKTCFARHPSLKQFDYDDPIADTTKKVTAAHHPLNRNFRGFTRHSVCSCLFNRHTSVSSYTSQPEKNAAAYQYLCLQAQLLIAYLNCRCVPDQIKKMLCYTGIEEWPQTPIASYSVSRAVRELNRTNYSDLVVTLHADSAPEDFSKALLTVSVPANFSNSPDRNKAKKDRKEAKLLLNYLQHYFSSVDAHLSGQFKKSRRKRRSSAKGNSRTLTGYIHFVPGVWIKQPPKEEDEDIAYDPAHLVQISDNADDSDCKEAEQSGLAPEEDRTPTIKLYNPDEFGGAMMRARQAEMAKRMAAQKFSWDYEVMTTTELHQLWEVLNKTISGYLALEKVTPTQTDSVQCALMVKIMLLLGQDLETVRTLHISHDGDTDIEGLVFHPPHNEKSAWWQLPSLEPQYRTDMPEKLARFGRIKSDHLALPDMGVLGNEVMSYLGHSGRKLKRVFSPERNNAQAGTQALLDQTIEKINPNGKPDVNQETIGLTYSEQRITHTKIRNALRTRIYQQSGDVAIEWITSAQIHYRNEPRLHYTNLSDQQVTSAYIRAAFRLLKDLGESVNSIPDIVAALPAYHGARFVASMDSVRKLISTLSSRLANSPSHYDRTGVIEYHNWLTLHVWLMQSLSTSIRAVNNPDTIATAIANNDFVKHVGLSDKENAHLADKARLVCLPELLSLQLHEYRHHVNSIKCDLGILSLFNDVKSRAIQHLFILDDHGKPHPVTRTWCEDKMEELDIPLPGNFHRGFLRTELIARKCSGQVVDAFLGHANQGESPFFSFSTMDYLKWQSTLFDALDSLISDTGIQLKKSALVKR
jgi:hypothetical protein